MNPALVHQRPVKPQLGSERTKPTEKEKLVEPSTSASLSCGTPDWLEGFYEPEEESLSEWPRASKSEFSENPCLDWKVELASESKRESSDLYLEEDTPVYRV